MFPKSGRRGIIIDGGWKHVCCMIAKSGYGVDGRMDIRLVGW